MGPNWMESQRELQKALKAVCDVQQLVTQAKDQTLQQVSKAKDESLKAASASEQARRAHDKLLHLRHKRNLRGAVEFIASDCLSEQTGKVQAKLNSLTKRQDFVEVLGAIAVTHNMPMKDCLMCLANPYHSLSKYMHGSDDRVVISQR